MGESACADVLFCGCFTICLEGDAYGRKKTAGNAGGGFRRTESCRNLLRKGARPADGKICRPNIRKAAAADLFLWQRLRSQYRNDLKAGCGEMARSRSVLGIFRAVSKPWRIERFRKIQAGRNAGDLSFGKRSDPGAGRNRETGAQPWNSLCLHCSERRQSAGTVLRCGDCKALRERAGLALD